MSNLDALERAVRELTTPERVRAVSVAGNELLRSIDRVEDWTERELRFGNGRTLTRVCDFEVASFTGEEIEAGIDPTERVDVAIESLSARLEANLRGARYAARASLANREPSSVDFRPYREGYVLYSLGPAPHAVAIDRGLLIIRNDDTCEVRFVYRANCGERR